MRLPSLLPNATRAGLFALPLVALLLAGCLDRPLPTDLSTEPMPNAPSLDVVGFRCIVTNAGTSGSGTLDDLLRREECRTIELNYSNLSSACALPGLVQPLPCGTVPVRETWIRRDVHIIGTGFGGRVTVTGEDRDRPFGIAAGANVEITNITVTGGENRSLYVGGAIRNEGNLTLTDVIGGLSNFGTLRLVRSTVSNNSAVGDGGGVWNQGTLSIESSTIEGNTAGGDGGGIYSEIPREGSSLSITNSTISGNAASGGGGIASERNMTTARIVSTTVANNTGGGIRIRNNEVPGAQGFQIVTSIIAGNSAGGAANLAYSGSGVASLIVVASFVGHGGAPVSNPFWTTIPDAELALGPLADNGGPTKTHALLPGNRAIDGSFCPSPPFAEVALSHDQRGIARPQGFACDAGAYEREDVTPPVISGAVSGIMGENGWYTSDVTVSWTVADSESPIATSTGCETTVVATDMQETTFTCSASSGGGSAEERVVVKRDATPPTPTFSYAPNPLLWFGPSTVEKGATDATSGVRSVDCGPPLNTFSLGRGLVTCYAYDNAGNTGIGVFPYTVGFEFVGFASPLKNDGVLNQARAGQAIPLKWRILDGRGSPVTGQSYAELTVVDLACASGSTVDQLEEYSAGESGLQEIGDGYYQLNWKTPRTYAGSCKALQLRLGDGAVRTAHFQFVK
jgi:hypothetical protein